MSNEGKLNKKIFASFVLVSLIVAGALSGLFTSVLHSTTGEGVFYIPLTVKDFEDSPNGCITIKNGELCLNWNNVLTIDGKQLRYNKWTKGLKISTFNEEDILLLGLPSMVTEFASLGGKGEPEPPEVLLSHSEFTYKDTSESFNVYIRYPEGNVNAKYLDDCTYNRMTILEHKPKVSPYIKYDSSWENNFNGRSPPPTYGKILSPQTDSLGDWRYQGVLTWKCYIGTYPFGKYHYAYNEVYNTETLSVKYSTTPPTTSPPTTPTISNIQVDPRTFRYDDSLKISADVTNAERVGVTFANGKLIPLISMSGSGKTKSVTIQHSEFHAGTYSMEIVADSISKSAGYMTVVTKPTTTTTTIDCSSPYGADGSERQVTIEACCDGTKKKELYICDDGDWIATTEGVGNSCSAQGKKSATNNECNTGSNLDSDGCKIDVTAWCTFEDDCLPIGEDCKAEETKWCPKLKNKILLSDWTKAKCDKEDVEECTNKPEPTTQPKIGYIWYPITDDDGCITNWKEVEEDEDECQPFPECLFTKPGLKEWIGNNLEAIGVFGIIFSLMVGIGYIVIRRK